MKTAVGACLDERLKLIYKTWVERVKRRSLIRLVAYERRRLNSQKLV